MLCGGVGFVRVNTVRVEPDFSKDDSMPADYDPRNVGFPKGEAGPFCEVKEKSWRTNAGKKPSRRKAAAEKSPAAPEETRRDPGTCTRRGRGRGETRASTEKRMKRAFVK